MIPKINHQYKTRGISTSVQNCGGLSLFRSFVRSFVFFSRFNAGVIVNDDDDTIWVDYHLIEGGSRDGVPTLGRFLCGDIFRNGKWPFLRFALPCPADDLPSFSRKIASVWVSVSSEAIKWSFGGKNIFQ